MCQVEGSGGGGLGGSQTHLGHYLTKSFLPQLPSHAHSALRGLASGVQCLHKGPSDFVCRCLFHGGGGGGG